jgi:HK97 family phage major capsid protein
MDDTQQAIKKRADEINTKIDGKYEELQKEIDKLHSEAAKNSAFTPSRNTFDSALQKQLTENQESLAALKDNSKGKVRLELKAIDMTTGAAFTGDVIAPHRMPSVSFDPDRSQHVRDFLPVTPITGDVVLYVQETAWDDGTAGQAEGAVKGQSSFTLEAVNAEVVTRATYLRVTRQMLTDTPFLRNYISTRAPRKLMLDEDQQVLYGDGTATNLTGITGEAQLYSEVLTAADITGNYDVIVNAISQLKSGEYNPDTVFITPTSYYNMAIQKGDDGHYLFDSGVRNGNAAMRIAGVRVVPITAMQGDDFLVGDFRMGATLGQRESISVQFFEQDRDNVITNQITIRIEHRIALPITNPNAFVYGDFTAALTTT